MLREFMCCLDKPSPRRTRITTGKCIKLSSKGCIDDDRFVEEIANLINLKSPGVFLWFANARDNAPFRGTGNAGSGDDTRTSVIEAELVTRLEFFASGGALAKDVPARVKEPLYHLAG